MTYQSLVLDFENSNFKEFDFTKFTLDFKNFRLKESALTLESLNINIRIRSEMSIQEILENSNDETLLQNLVFFFTQNADRQLVFDDFKEINQFQDYLIFRIGTFIKEHKEPESVFSVDFKTSYPEFQNIDSKRIDAVYDKIACLYPFSKNLNNCRNKQLTYLLVAHYLSMDNSSSGAGFGGAVSSASIGSVSVSFSQINNSYSAAFFSNTKYGLEFLSIRSKLGSATLVN